MKSLAIGCFGVIIGIIIGAFAVFAAGFLLAPSVLPSSAAVPVLVPAGQSDISVSVSARYVDAEIQQAVIQTGLARQATTTLIAPNQLQVATTVPVTLLGESVPVDVTATMGLQVQNGRVLLSVDEINAEGISVPPSLVSSQIEQVRADGERTINQAVQSSLQGTSLHLASIRVLSNSLVLDLVSN